MASRTLPNIGLKGFWGTGFDGWAAENDLNLLKLSVLTQGRALAIVTGRPSSPSNGQVYVVSEAGGADANKIIIRDNGAWIDLTPLAGWRLYNVAIGTFITFNGTAWVPALDALPDPTGRGGYVLGVNSGGTAYELVQLPGGITTVENAALKYRFVVTTAGTGGGAGWGEIQTYARDFSQAIPVAVTASSTLAGGYSTTELTNNILPGAPGSEGWMANTGAEIGAWVEFEYAEPVGLLSVVFYEAEDYTNTPQGVDIEYYDTNTSSWELLQHYDMTWGPSTLSYSATPLPLVPTDATVGGEYLIDAPSDGTTYGRKDGAWEAIGASANLFELKGTLDCSANPNYPAGETGDAIVVSADGKIGGASGEAVETSDILLCINDNAGGTQAAVGADWTVIQGNVALSSLKPPYSVPFGSPDVPISSQVLALHVFGELVTFADDWFNSVGTVGVNPTSSFIMTVYKNGASVGTITIGTGGSFTYTTTGGTVTFNAGDVLKITAPATADATAALIACTLVGTRA